MTGLKCGMKKSNRPFGAFRLPEVESNEPPPIRFPPSQLSSMNLVTEVVSVSLLLTWFARGPGRDHQHRQPLAVTAAVGEAAQPRRRRVADRGVQRRIGAVHDDRGLVVIPAVGVVV